MKSKHNILDVFHCFKTYRKERTIVKKFITS